MATSKQEKIYNEVIEYYAFADKLISIAENSSEKYSQQQFNIIEKLVTAIEDSADEITSKYIDFIKDGESEEISEATRVALNKISERIEDCRNKIMMLHHKDEE